MTFDSVGVIGGGAWGTALAQTLRLAGRQVRLWVREAEVAAEINASHANSAFLPSVTLDSGLEATTELADIASLDVVLMVAPAQHVRGVAGALAPHLPAACPRPSRSPSPTRRLDRCWQTRSAPAPCASTGRATQRACSWGVR